MSSAIELSVKFGIPSSAVIALCDYIGYSLDDEKVEYSKEFETLARSIKRKRASAYVMAFLFRNCTDDERGFALSLDDDFAEDFYRVEFPVYPAEKLENAKFIIDSIYETQRGEKRGEWTEFEKWLKKTISEASGEISHSYIAVRLLLSVPENEMRNYPQIIASLMNKARHRGYLDGWFRLEPLDNGTNRCIYSDPEKVEKTVTVDEQWLSADMIDQTIKLLKRDDVKSIAGWISHKTGREFEETKKAVEKILAAKISFDL